MGFLEGAQYFFEKLAWHEMGNQRAGFKQGSDLSEEGSNVNGNTLLHYAAKSGDKTVIRYVLGFKSMGDDRVQYINKKNKQNMAAYLYAAESCYVEAWEYLIEEMVKSEIDWYIKVQTQVATTAESIVKILRGSQNLEKQSFNDALSKKLESGPLDESDSRNNTILHYMAQCERFFIKFSRFLMGSININVQNEFGNTPIHLAALHNNLELIIFFVEEKRPILTLKTMMVIRQYMRLHGVML